MRNIGFPKNEGCTRNFLGRGNAAAQAMNFITIKFEQAQRALTTRQRMDYNDRYGFEKQQNQGNGVRYGRNFARYRTSIY